MFKPGINVLNKQTKKQTNGHVVNILQLKTNYQKNQYCFCAHKSSGIKTILSRVPV